MANKILEEIKAKMAKIDARFRAVIAKYEEFVAKEGPVLVIDGEPEAGKVVMIKDAETGAESVAPAGEYTLPDGRVLKVDAEGKITEIIPPAVEVEMEDVETFSDAFNKSMDMMWKMLEMYESTAATLAAILSANQATEGEVIILKEQVAKFAKQSPATFTSRTPATVAKPTGSNARFSAENSTMAERIRLSQMKRMAAIGKKE